VQGLRQLRSGRSDVVVASAGRVDVQQQHQTMRKATDIWMQRT